jgi:hypothetical protein
MLEKRDIILNFNIVKKIKKIVILVSAFAMPTIASPATCNCYNEFNTGWQAANSSYFSCSYNYLYAPVIAWGSYFGGNNGGSAGTIYGAFSGLQNCTNSFYAQWNALGRQFDFCIKNNCN